MGDDDAQAIPHSPETGPEVLRRGRWTCRLHIWHRWRTYVSTHPDQYGRRYQECLDCRKQRNVSMIGSAGIAGPYPDEQRP